MPINRPYRRTCRQFVDGSYTEGGRWQYMVHPKFAQAPGHYVRAFLLLLKDLQELFDYIEPADKNLVCFSYRIHALLLRACVEVEANCKAILKENGYSKLGDNYAMNTTFQNLRQFVNFLEEHKQLKHIRHPVTPILEITEIVDRVSKGLLEKNLALLFENIPGYSVPLLINAFGTTQRMTWALGVDDLNELNDRISHTIDIRLPKNFGEARGRGLDLLKVVKSIGLKPLKVKNAPVQKVVYREQLSMDFLPILQCWPNDGGRFMTLPQVIKFPYIPNRLI